jgi:hemoglobin/transferrin/lactoferrin receptor protein
MHSLSYSNFKQTKFFDGAKVILAYQGMQESRHDRKFQNNLLRSRTENVDVFSLNIDLDKKISDQGQLYYGAEFLKNVVSSRGFIEDINTDEVTATSTRYPDGGSDYSAISFYAKYKRRLLTNLTSTAGIRYSNIKINAAFDDKTFYNFPYDELSLDNGAVSGSLGLVYSLPNNLKLSTMLASGFRSPNIDDVGKVFDSEPGNVVVPNDNLSPEYTYTAELGITKNIQDKVQLEGVVYYTWLKDAIVRRDFTFNGSSTILYDGVESEVEALVNVGEAYVFGFSLGFKTDLSTRFSFASSFNYNEGEDKAEQVPLRHTTPNFGQSALTYKAKKVKTEFYVKYNGARKIKDFSPSELNKPHLYNADGSLAWITYNLRGSYQFTEKLSATAAIENITDLHYRPYSSGISAPGRNLVVSLRGSF